MFGSEYGAITVPKKVGISAMAPACTSTASRPVAHGHRPRSGQDRGYGLFLCVSESSLSASAQHTAKLVVFGQSDSEDDRFRVHDRPSEDRDPDFSEPVDFIDIHERLGDREKMAPFHRLREVYGSPA